VERLGDVVVSTELHRFDGGGAAAQGGNDDDGHFFQLILVLAQQVHPCLSRHLEVEEDERHRWVAEYLVRLETICCLHHSVALGLKQQPEVRADHRVVVCYQDGCLLVWLRHDVMPMQLRGPEASVFDSRSPCPQRSTGRTTTKVAPGPPAS